MHSPQPTREALSIETSRQATSWSIAADRRRYSTSVWRSCWTKMRREPRDSSYGTYRGGRTIRDRNLCSAGTSARRSRRFARGCVFDRRTTLRNADGHLALSCKTSVDVRHAVVHDNPTPLNEARPGPTPPRLQQVLDRALAKNPRDRYQKVSELRDDLKSLLRETRSGGVSQFDEVAPLMAPRHLNSKVPVASRASLVKDCHRQRPQRHSNDVAPSPTCGSPRNLPDQHWRQRTQERRGTSF